MIRFSLAQLGFVPELPRLDKLSLASLIRLGLRLLSVEFSVLISCPTATSTSRFVTCWTTPEGRANLR